jgi:hypothetical protein
MGKLYDSLQLNFDTSKFKEALDPMNDLQERIDERYPLVRKWQYDAIANNEISSSLYFKNPVINVVNSIISTVSSANGFLFSFGILANANVSISNLANTANAFLEHTQRVSGVKTSPNTAEPDFFTAKGKGEIAFSLVSKFEGVSNNSPILGSMTSLFIGDDLENIQTQLASGLTDLRNSIVAVGFPFTYQSNLSSVRITEILNTVNVANTLMYERYTSDIQYFGRLRNLTNNYTEIIRYSSFGDLDSHLISEYIGTDKLLKNL